MLQQICPQPPPTLIRDKRLVAGLVEHLMAHGVGNCTVIERRKERRFPFTGLIQLRGLDRDDQLVGEPVLAMGKQISFSGIGFYHREVLTEVGYLVSAASNPSECGNMLLFKPRWCRFVGPGWYESGGQFMGIGQANNFPENDLPSPST